MRAFKFRIYPTKKQSVFLCNTLVNCQRLYNTALEHRREAYRISKKGISYKEQQNELPKLKEQFPEYYSIHSQVLQDVLCRVDLAFKHFFRRAKIDNDRAGFPRYKSKDRYDSFCYPQNNYTFKICNNKVRLSKIGLIKVRFHRAIPADAKIKTCTIKREGSRWYVVFVCDIANHIAPKKVVSSAIGIDLGLTNFAVLSNGLGMANPKYLKKSEDKLKTIQSRYSQRKSKKVKHQLTNLHKKVANQRKDFQHKLSHSLVHGFDLIAYEDLKVKSMIEDNKYNLQKHIHDAAWGQFISMLVYKAENAGTTVIAVNPKGTTQKCSYCDTVVPKTLYERSHKCPTCGFEATRDYNAALNIHKLGINLAGNSVCTPFVHPFLSAEVITNQSMTVHIRNKDKKQTY